MTVKCAKHFEKTLILYIYKMFHSSTKTDEISTYLHSNNPVTIVSFSCDRDQTRLCSHWAPNCTKSWVLKDLLNIDLSVVVRIKLRTSYIFSKLLLLSYVLIYIQLKMIKLSCRKLDSVQKKTKIVYCKKYENKCSFCTFFLSF